MIQRLLLAVDGSDPADRTASLAVALADRLDAELDVLHVPEGSAGTEDERRERGRALVGEAAALAGDAGVATETHVRAGDPHEVILDLADEVGADLVALGRHGRAGVAERLLGTVTDRVLRGTDVPVLTVPAGESAPALDGDVLVTTDGSENATAAAALAGTIATAAGGALHVLSVYDVEAAAGVFDAGGVDSAFVERLEGRARAATEEMAKQVRATAGDREVLQAVDRGVPHRAIGAYADDHDVAFLAMASTGTSNLAGRYLGSVTDRVLRTVQRPVVVVPS